MLTTINASLPCTLGLAFLELIFAKDTGRKMERAATAGFTTEPTESRLSFYRAVSIVFNYVAMRNSYTVRLTAASIWEILSLTVLLTRGHRHTSTHQLPEHEDCI